MTAGDEPVAGADAERLTAPLLPLHMNYGPEWPWRFQNCFGPDKWDHNPLDSNVAPNPAVLNSAPSRAAHRAQEEVPAQNSVPANHIRGDPAASHPAAAMPAGVWPLVAL